MSTTDPDQRRAANQRYYAKHGDRLRDEAREREARRREEHGEALNARRRAHAAKRQGDPAYRALRAEANLLEKRNLRTEVVAGYGGECVCCGNDYLPHLTLDHVAGGGCADRRTRGSDAIYRDLRRKLRAGTRDDAFQLLCWNCNAAKHHLGVCGCQH